MFTTVFTVLIASLAIGFAVSIIIFVPAFMDHGSATKLRYFDAGALIFPKQFRQCLHIEAFFHFFQITGFCQKS